MAVLEDYEKLTEDELDEKISDILKKIDIALGTKLEKQRFEMIQGRTPEEYNITDEEIDKPEKKD